MASTGLMNGTLLVLQISTDGSSFTNLGHSTSSSLSFNLDTPRATSKDSGGYEGLSQVQDQSILAILLLLMMIPLMLIL